LSAQQQAEAARKAKLEAKLAEQAQRKHDAELAQQQKQTEEADRKRKAEAEKVAAAKAAADKLAAEKAAAAAAERAAVAARAATPPPQPAPVVAAAPPPPSGPSRGFSASPVSGGAPTYPAAYQDDQRKGKVTVSCTIGTDGSPSGCHVVAVQGGAQFGSAVMSWLSGGVRFAPILRNGQPVVETHQWTMNFQP
jgi:TonB family protein